MREARGVEGVKTSSLLGSSMVEIPARGGCINVSKGENSTGFYPQKRLLSQDGFARGFHPGSLSAFDYMDQPSSSTH